MPAWIVKIFRLLAIFILSLLLVPSASMAQQVQVNTPIPARFGVSIGWQAGEAFQSYVLTVLDPPVYYNWIYNHLEDPEYVPMAFTIKPTKFNTYKAAAIAANPRRSWMLGNEPELPTTIVTPAEAKQFVTDWKNQVGGTYACCGVLWTNLWTDDETWLNSYLAAGGPIPSYWHIHIYYTCAWTEFDAEIASFKTWMTAHNATRPIILSETNGKNCTTAGQQDAYMQRIDWKVDIGAIYAAMWYTAYDGTPEWSFANLTDSIGIQPTGLGYLYISIR